MYENVCEQEQINDMKRQYGFLLDRQRKTEEDSCSGEKNSDRK